MAQLNKMANYKLVTDKLLSCLQAQVRKAQCEPDLRLYTPTSSSDPSGGIGDVTYDANFIYVKLAATTWKRSALSSF